MKQRQATIYDEEYQALISRLVAFRKAQGLTQQDLAKRIGFLQHDVSKVENCIRRLDILELRNWLHGLGVKNDIFQPILNILNK